MTLHRNARTCPRSRRLLADRVLVEDWSLAAAAEAAGVSERTAWKWVDRYRREGEAGLADRASSPKTVPSRTPADREELILLLRELRFTSPEIAETLGMPLSTVGAVLARNGLGKLPRLRPNEPANSYERPRPGELDRVNNDRTTRTRGIGWEYVHVAVDDATRLAYVEVLEDEKGTTAAGFLRRAVAFFRRYGIRVERTLSDKAPATARSRTRSPASGSASATYARAPIGHAHTERQSGSSAPSSTAGPTAPSTAPAPNAPPPSPAGSTGTTGSDHIAHSAASHR